MKIKTANIKRFFIPLLLLLVFTIAQAQAQEEAPPLESPPDPPDTEFQDIENPDFDIPAGPDGAGQSPPGPSDAKDEEPVNLTADRMLHLVKKNLVKAEGNVVVTYGPRTVTADEIIVNTETGKGQAKGNVVMTAEKGTSFQAEKAYFNVKAEKGRLFKVAGKLGDLYYITGEEVTKLGEDHYSAKDATLTTCKGKVPDWRIDVAESDIILDDRAWFMGGVFRIKNVPVLYIPIGYVPIVTKRKSGFLAPRFSTSNVDGETVGVTYFWAINQWSDATLGVDYVERRGIRSLTEFRYAPSKTTYGKFNGVILDDNLTGDTFWKIDAIHRQHLPLGFKLNAKIDQTSKANFNKTFRNQTELRTRRSSDSYANFFRKWDNHSFDVLARFRESEQAGIDDTFGLLPTVTYKTQPVDTGLWNIYFDQEASYTNFFIDLDPNITSDFNDTIQRFDFHPSLSLSMDLAPWLQLTPRVGFRETFYNKEINFTAAPLSHVRKDKFSRELYDVNVLLEGPKFNRVFGGKDEGSSGYKHVIEPRIRYDYIPDMDEEDRSKIRVFDAIDSIQSVNKFTFFLVQRLLKKEPGAKAGSEVRQIARLEISQGLDMDEATRDQTPGNPRRPLSLLRVDLDSKLTQNFFLNTDATFNVYDDTMETWNIDAGYKLFKWLMLIFERREIRNQTASILGTVGVTLPKGWKGKYSLRYDEFNDNFLEHNGRLTYNDKCMCWGFAIDFIDRNIITGTFQSHESRVMFSITLRGLGTLNGARGESFIHRSF